MNSAKINEDFDVFSRALFSTKDTDPDYLAMKWTVQETDQEIDPIWYSFVYGVFVHLGSSYLLTKDYPNASDFIQNKSKFISNFEKYNFFGKERKPPVRQPLTIANMLFDAAIQIQKFYDEEDCLINFDSNIKFCKSITQLTNYGYWTGYKIAEILEKSFDIKSLVVTDLGIDTSDVNGNRGPVGGLRLLYDYENSVKFESSIRPVWNNLGNHLAKAYGVNIGEVETCFCKIKKASVGNYYIGADIDVLMEELYTHLNNSDKKRYISFMEEEFTHIFPFVRKNMGVSKPLKKIYKQTGKIINSEFIDQYNPVDIGLMIDKSFD